MFWNKSFIDLCGCSTGPVGPKTFGKAGKSNGLFAPLAFFSFGSSFKESIPPKTLSKKEKKPPSSSESSSFLSDLLSSG